MGVKNHSALLCAALFVLLLLPASSIAEKPNTQKLDIEKVAGVYKRTRPNGTVGSDEVYQTEDVLEIVKYSPNAAYFRTRLRFYNGHLCDLSGIAEVEGSLLVYREPIFPPPDTLRYTSPAIKKEGQCVLQIVFSGDKVSFKDEKGKCRNKTCGARGGYELGSRQTFDRSKRRKIRYMERLKNSGHYQSAVEDYEDGKKAQAQ